ncbi:MAG: N-acetylmuramoyl-L-alanine amidase, partial [Alphaproteobacteria bacterium]
LSNKKSFLSNSFILDDPPRLVVDINNIDSFSKKNFNYKLIKKIRASKTNDKARLVFDLKVPIKNFKKTIISGKNNNYTLLIDLSLFSTQESFNQNYNKNIIVIDAGHGGPDPGAVRNNIKEKDLTLSAAKFLEKELLKKNFKVYLTRNSDRYIKLRNRVKYARNKSADLFISIHADSTLNKNTNGTSIYSLSEKASDKLSQALADRDNKSDLIAGLDLDDLDKDVSDILIDLSRRETKNSSINFAELFISYLEKQKFNLLRRPHRQAGFAVLKAPDVPSVLIEMGFISNNSDLKKLTNPKFQKQLMKNVADIIEKYFQSIK